ncbi:hypothetical protein APD05_11805 [Acinetobacter nosocomialis]|nr:hypothetical protein APD05_11805 [Acinetobacter nosocomialis]
MEMSFCSFNWELASKFVPLITPIVSVALATFVYRIWHKQKGKEVVANEAKEFIIKLAKLQSLQMDEPYRVCRRLSILRECSDDQIKIYP